jgi:hypothetical protein
MIIIIKPNYTKHTTKVTQAHLHKTYNKCDSSVVYVMNQTLQKAVTKVSVTKLGMRSKTILFSLKASMPHQKNICTWPKPISSQITSILISPTVNKNYASSQVFETGK